MGELDAAGVMPSALPLALALSALLSADIGEASAASCGEPDSTGEPSDAAAAASSAVLPSAVASYSQLLPSCDALARPYCCAAAGRSGKGSGSPWRGPEETNRSGWQEGGKRYRIGLCWKRAMSSALPWMRAYATSARLRLLKWGHRMPLIRLTSWVKSRGSVKFKKA